MKPFSDQLREAILKCGKSRYRISKEAKLNEGMLSRFMNSKEHGLSMETVNKLCECIGARLVLEKEVKKAAGMSSKTQKRRKAGE